MLITLDILAHSCSSFRDLCCWVGVGVWPYITWAFTPGLCTGIYISRKCLLPAVSSAIASSPPPFFFAILDPEQLIKKRKKVTIRPPCHLQTQAYMFTCFSKHVISFSKKGWRWVDKKNSVAFWILLFFLACWVIFINNSLVEPGILSMQARQRSISYSIIS